MRKVSISGTADVRIQVKTLLLEIFKSSTVWTFQTKET